MLRKATHSFKYEIFTKMSGQACQISCQTTKNKNQSVIFVMLFGSAENQFIANHKSNDVT